MPDTRPRLTAGKTINLKQLDSELGGYGLCFDAETSEVVVAEGSPVTQEDLQAAYDAHVAADPPAAPPTTTELSEEIHAALADRDEVMAELLALLLGI